MLDFVNKDALGGARSRACASPHPRYQRGTKSELRGLAQAGIALTDRTDLTAQADFAEYDHVGRHRLVCQ